MYGLPFRQTQHAGESGWLAKITYQQPTDSAVHNEFLPLGFLSADYFLGF